MCSFIGQTNGQAGLAELKNRPILSSGLQNSVACYVVYKMAAFLFPAFANVVGQCRQRTPFWDVHLHSFVKTP